MASVASASSSAPLRDVSNKLPMSIEDTYQKKTQLEHILLRPDTYVGSIERTRQECWVFDGGRKFTSRTIEFVPGLYKIFDEILVNAADNKQRDPSMSLIDVEINPDTGRISVWNDGHGIPIQIHKKEGCYVPELIFGHLLTSSNYNDTQKKTTGGRNGYGAKLANIFSKEFVVETADGVQIYKQVFKNNMSVIGKPQIRDNPKGKEYTKISFLPDFARFGMDALEADTVSLLAKRVYDMAGVSDRSLRVKLNGERIKVSSFKDYVQMYLPDEDPLVPSERPVFHNRINNRWEIVVTQSDGHFEQVSFVNAICTRKGGAHVKHIADQIASKLLVAANKGRGKSKILREAHCKNQLWVFLNCLIENPAFDSQTKDTLTTRVSSFGSTCEVPDSMLKAIVKSPIMDAITRFANFKASAELKKSDGRKKSKLSGIAKLDDANWAGTKKSQQCTLILTEGDSAKSMAVSGISVIPNGRDQYGIFPLRGKLLNVREASSSVVAKNAEISALKQILGLKQGTQYTDTSSLRYGHIMIMTDQDHDGSHIKGLIINFLDASWPSLLRIPSFLVEFVTPIVKVTKGSTEICFFTLQEYMDWRAANQEVKGWTIKYYKGLGTSSNKEAKDYFSKLENHQIDFLYESELDSEAIAMAFTKSKADARKSWLTDYYDPNVYVDHSQPTLSYRDFIYKELIHFSMADVQRSIPSVVDGFKPGHRKILFSCFKRNLVKEIKVAQLSGYVAEHSAYHHGENSLASTIVGMAQNFVGSNNISLLMPNGQFGTRLQGGKDAASARYIFTQLSKLARLVFPVYDDPLLKYQEDDGQSIEPVWYMPVVPMILVNGCDGIGTGWSTFIPSYNPRDLVSNILRKLDGEEFSPMVPWFKNFKGDVIPKGEGKFEIAGLVHQLDNNTIEILELPIRKWTQDYKEWLESITVGAVVEKSEKDKKEKKGLDFQIEEFFEHHTENSVRFLIKLDDSNMAKMHAAHGGDLHKAFKLSTTISLTNMHALEHTSGRVVRYESPLEILEDFYHLRLNFYEKRKTFLFNKLSDELEKLENRVRFVRAVISGEIVVSNRKKLDLLMELKAAGYRMFLKNTSEEDESENSDMEDSTGTTPTAAQQMAKLSSGYDYLLSTKLWNLTSEKIDELLRQHQVKKDELNELLSTSEQDMWRKDLQTLLEGVDDVDNMERLVMSHTPSAKGKGRHGKKGRLAKLIQEATPLSASKGGSSSGMHRLGSKLSRMADMMQLDPSKAGPSSISSGLFSSSIAGSANSSNPFAASSLDKWATLGKKLESVSPAKPAVQAKPAAAGKRVKASSNGGKKGPSRPAATAAKKSKKKKSILDSTDSEAESDFGSDSDSEFDVDEFAPTTVSARNLPSRSARVAASKSLVSAMKEESESESGDGSDEEDAAMSDASEDYVPSAIKSSRPPVLDKKKRLSSEAESDSDSVPPPQKRQKAPALSKKKGAAPLKTVSSVDLTMSDSSDDDDLFGGASSARNSSFDFLESDKPAPAKKRTFGAGSTGGKKSRQKMIMTSSDEDSYATSDQENVSPPKATGSSSSSSLVPGKRGKAGKAGKTASAASAAVAKGKVGKAGKRGKQGVSSTLTARGKTGKAASKKKVSKNISLVETSDEDFSASDDDAPVVVSSRPARATARVAASKVKSYKMDVDSDSEEEEEEQDGSSSEDMAEDSDSSFGL